MGGSGGGKRDGGGENAERGREGARGEFEGTRGGLEGAAAGIKFNRINLPSRERTLAETGIRHMGEAALARMRYQASLSVNEADLEEVRHRHEEIRGRYLNPGKQKNAMDVGMMDLLAERVRIDDGGDVQKTKRAMKGDLGRHRRAVREGTYFILHGKQASADDPQLRERQLRTLSRAAKKLKKLKGKAREDFTREFASVHKLAEQSPEKVATTLLVLRRQEEDAEFMATALDNDRFLATFSSRAQVSDNPEEAFMAAIEASPELRERYRLYVEDWQSENFANVFVPVVEGAEVTELKSEFDAGFLGGNGVVLDMGENNRGEVTFGNLTCDVAIYNVNGQPKVFIYNEEADRGVAGPFDAEPEALRAALGDVVVDEYFSRQFRLEAGGSSQNDPTKIPDETLFGIVHAVAPDGWGHYESWTENQRAFVGNLAKIFASDDAPIREKVDFFRHQVLPNADRVREMKRMLFYEPLKSTSFKEFAEGLK